MKLTCFKGGSKEVYFKNKPLKNIVIQEYRFLKLQSGAKTLLYMRYFSSKFAYQTIKSGKKAFVLLLKPLPPSNIAILL